MKPTGPHPREALTAVKIRQLRKPGRYADGNGLYLVVNPNGAKKWVLRTVVHGERRDMGLGSADLVPLVDARDDARRYRRIARAGGDPFKERNSSSVEAPTFEEAARKVHGEHKASWRNPKHQTQWINTLTAYAFPVIGSKRVDLIEFADVLMVLGPIWLTKPETARRVRQRIRTVLDWARAAGFTSGENPADRVTLGLPKQPNKAGHHKALAYTEVAAFVEELRSCTAGETVKLAFEFLILTAARTSEVLLAEWREIDLNSATWTVPAGRMKALREHRVPLSLRAVEILTQAKELAGTSQLVFPRRRTSKPLSNMALLMALRRLRPGTTVHGFRSAFRDWAAEQTSFPHEVAEMALAHAIRNKAEAAYRRGDLFERRRGLMATWAAYIDHGSVVVPITSKVKT